MKSKRELQIIFLATRAYKERRKRSLYAKVMNFTSSVSKIRGCQAPTTWHKLAATRQVTEGVQSMEEDRFDSPRRGHHLPRRGTPQKCPYKQISRAPSSIAQFPSFSRRNSAFKPPRPSQSPGFHLQVPKEGFVFSRFPRFPRFSRVFNSSCRSSARFFSRLLQNNHFNQVSSYPYNYIFKCFVNVFIHF